MEILFKVGMTVAAVAIFSMLIALGVSSLIYDADMHIAYATVKIAAPAAFAGFALVLVFMVYTLWTDL